MTTTLEILCRMLAAVSLLLLAAPASNAADNGAPLPDAGVAKARALFEGGKFEEALAVLRPLALQAPDRADILFLIGLAAIEYAQRPDTTEAERDERLDEAIASLRAMLIERPELRQQRDDAGNRPYWQYLSMADLAPREILQAVRQCSYSGMGYHRLWFRDSGGVWQPAGGTK